MFKTVKGVELALGKNESWSGANLYVACSPEEINSLSWSWSVEQRDTYEKLMVTSNKVAEQC